MCKRIQCESCGKPSFAGCGMHVEQVLGDVAPTERCQCREQARAARAAQPSAASTKRFSWLQKLRR
jgi:hypothetical protein